MRVLSINRSLPKTIEWRGKTVTTGIFKRSVDEAVKVTEEGLSGDGQANLAVHGGVDKAVYAYPQEHYSHFARLLGRSSDDFPFGQFGENLSTEGLLESEVMIGDRYRVGEEAVFEVSQPREPCFKLGMVMQDPGFLRSFLQSMKTGFYLRVINNGRIQAGDPIQLIHRSENSLSVADITRLRFLDTEPGDDHHRAAQLETLTQSWREDFLSRL